MEENNEIVLNDISKELLIINKFTIENLFELDNCADCIALYIFYYKTAKWQNTNRIKATDLYVKKVLKWSANRIMKTKATLKEKGLIDIVQQRKDGKINGWYIQVNYLITNKKQEEIKIKVDDSKNSPFQELEISRTRNQDTNAYIIYIKCLYNIIEMLSKEIDNNKLLSKKKPNNFVPPTLEEVKAYCEERQNNIDYEHFVDYYISNGWNVGKTKMKDWKAAIRNWERREKSSAKREESEEKGIIAPYV